jgi:uncharacterized damage-inducible protein DinB
MSDLKTTRILFAYTEWADAMVWTAMLRESSFSADERLREYLFHIHTVQHLFLSVWRGGPLTAPPNEAKSVTSLLTLARSTHSDLTSFLTSLDEDLLSQNIQLPWAGRFTELTGKEPAPITLGETLLQVANHSTYHRGQINSRLREIGGTPPMTDFIAWVGLGKPGADWPEPSPQSTNERP